MRTVAKICCLSVFALVSSSCKDLSQVSTVAYVIGPDDIKPITSKNRKDISLLHLSSSVVIATHINDHARKFCSGTLIVPESEDGLPRILTNHHCFAEAEGDKHSVSADLLPGHCTTTKVYFGFIKGETDQVEVGECLEESFRNDFEGDLAVFTLKAAPSSRFVPAQLWSQATIPEGRQARVVHYPTVDLSSDTVFVPSVGISLPVAQVTLEDCVTKGVFPEAEWGLDKSLAMGVKHTCDLKKGSSGSALWDVDTDVILGVNWGGIVLKYQDPVRTETYNVATRASYVRSFLKGEAAHEKSRIKDQSDQYVEAEAAIQKDSNSSGKAKGLNLKGCGVAGTGTGAGGMTWLALLLPLLGAGINRVRRRS